MEFMGNDGHAPSLPILCGFASVSHTVACARTNKSECLSKNPFLVAEGSVRSFTKWNLPAKGFCKAKSRKCEVFPKPFAQADSFRRSGPERPMIQAFRDLLYSWIGGAFYDQFSKKCLHFFERVDFIDTLNGLSLFWERPWFLFANMGWQTGWKMAIIK